MKINIKNLAHSVGLLINGIKSQIDWIYFGPANSEDLFFAKTTSFFFLGYSSSTRKSAIHSIYFALYIKAMMGSSAQVYELYNLEIKISPLQFKRIRRKTVGPRTSNYHSVVSLYIFYNIPRASHINFSTISVLLLINVVLVDTFSRPRSSTRTSRRNV